MIGAATRSSGRILALAFGCLALVAVSGCTSEPPPERPVAAPTETTAETPDPSASPSPDETPDPSSTDVCLGKRPYNPDSAPYAGKGPHPITIVHNDPGPARLELRYVTLPDGWNPAVGIDPMRKDLDKIQLVVCDDPTPILAGGGTIGTCEFDQPGMSGSMHVVQADHAFVVREARSGRGVALIRLRGTAGAQDSCPSMAMDSGGTQIAQAVDDDTATAKLRPLYEGPARKLW